LIGGEDVNSKKLHIGPSIKLGIRYWNGNSNNLMEFFVRYDTFSQIEVPNLPPEIVDIKPSFISIGWSKFLGY